MSTHKRSFGALGGGGQAPLPPAAGDGAALDKTAAEGSGLVLAQNPPAGTPCKGSVPSHARYCKIADTDSICIDANLRYIYAPANFGAHICRLLVSFASMLGLF